MRWTETKQMDKTDQTRTSPAAPLSGHVQLLSAFPPTLCGYETITAGLKRATPNHNSDQQLTFLFLHKPLYLIFTHSCCLCKCLDVNMYKYVCICTVLVSYQWPSNGKHTDSTNVHRWILFCDPCNLLFVYCKCKCDDFSGWSLTSDLSLLYFKQQRSFVVRIIVCSLSAKSAYSNWDK